MNIIRVVGKAHFYSEKKQRDYFTLHTVFKKQGIEGDAVEVKFVSSDIFNSVSIGCLYQVVYGAYDNGRAYISELIQVERS